MKIASYFSDSKVNYSIANIAAYVILNMIITISLWTYVYETKTDVDSLRQIFFDLDSSKTTGNVFFDGILNGFLIFLYIAVLTITLVAAMIFKFKRLLTIYIQTSFIIVFCVVIPRTILRDLIVKCLLDYNTILVETISMFYAMAVIAVFYTDRVPIMMRQLLCVLNCSFVSVYYLRLLPRYTIWFVFLAIVFWDLFAVNSSFGPLKIAIKNARDYSEDILRFIIFTADPIDVDDDRFSVTTQTTNTSEVSLIDDDSTSIKEQENEEIQTTEDSANTNLNKSFTRKNAFDALNDPNVTRLGMGDIIMYGVLIGKASENGSTLALIAAITGVIIGLIISLLISSDFEETYPGETHYYPALPIPLVLGTTMYFGAVYSITGFNAIAGGIESVN